MYPNPANEVLTISFPEKSSHLIRLLEISGKELRRANSNGVNPIEMVLTEFPSGLYVLEVTGESGNITHQRIIKE
ncbi:MAG: T9SS type A sorting domain-containing protein [Crocinitomicaceae bacterium]|nr:T9SS type A sorting domain-containing protein [Crocinitomicaceae bacterium]